MSQLGSRRQGLGHCRCLGRSYTLLDDAKARGTEIDDRERSFLPFGSTGVAWEPWISKSLRACSLLGSSQNDSCFEFFHLYRIFVLSSIDASLSFSYCTKLSYTCLVRMKSQSHGCLERFWGLYHTSYSLLVPEHAGPPTSHDFAKTYRPRPRRGSMSMPTTLPARASLTI